MKGRSCLSLLPLLLVLAGRGQARVREYFVAVNEVDWDYAPAGKNLLNILRKSESQVDVFLKAGPDRIGHVYRKAIYQQFKDATFSELVPAPDWLGLVGPMLKAEVGDSMVVNFLNNASREYSMHPHGVHYDKRNEGAFYRDGTSGKDKADDIVMPGSKVRYVWNVTSSMAPSSGDPNCLPWVYHSHIATQHDTSSGLIGILVTCKPGTLDAAGRRTDVDKEFALMVKVFDENLSWLLADNLNKCGQPDLCKSLSKDGDEGFVESNLLHAMNGYVFGNLPGLSMCAGERVAWYVVGMGNEMDLHNLYFHGQTLHYLHRSGDTVPAHAGSFVAAEMTPVNPGHWTVNCVVDDHLQAGMAAPFTVQDCGRAAARTTSSPNNRRWQYLTVEEEEWDYAPGGWDTFSRGELNDTHRESAARYTQGKDRIGSRYRKARFHAYEDAVFIQRKPVEENLGILGPVIRAEEGDHVAVALRNKASRPYSIRLHSAHYDLSETTFIETGVDPGAVHVFDFQVPQGVLGPRDGDCIVQMYTSAVDVIRDVSSGLVGPFLICRKGVLSRAPSSKKKEFFLLFNTFDENKSYYLDDNIRHYCGDPGSVNKDDADFQESNMMTSINGRAYGTLNGLEMCLKDSVTWYVMGLGSEPDINGAYFHGNTVTRAGRRRDRQDLIPGTTASLAMVPDNPGLWAVVSETHSMMQRGMQALYVVRQCDVAMTPQHVTGVTRRYAIAAEEVEWDFAPSERELITGIDLNDPRSEANIFVRDDDEFIGDTYKKAVYREYTDSTFTTPKSRDNTTIHLGILGPLLKAEVGDVIEVIFLNKASRPYSLHPHGLLYDKASEGATYTGGVYLEDNAGVPPGAMHIYRWHVPERSGPGPEDTACIPWLYISHVDPVKDVESGLVGAVVVCRHGTLTSDGRRRDVDRELALLFAVFNENLSWYLEDNVRNHAPARVSTDYSSDGDFEESNKMHGINGQIFGNNPGLEMFVNDSVVWYFLSVGSDIDIHTVHLHGHTYIESSDYGRRNDVTVMFPGNARAVEMVADNPGTWVLHCHVLDHIMAGMETAYTVKDRPH